MKSQSQTKTFALVSVMFCFFAMGFVDLVGTASNYLKSDLHLSDTLANLLPSMVFFWFLLFSVPTGILMNKIGRKKTVLLSLVVTLVSLLLPLFGETLPVMLLACCLLGIGNALMQTSLNPLITSVMGSDNMAATLTFGQFIKAIASFMAPFIATWGATHVIPDCGQGWRVLFLIYLVVGVIATLLLWGSHINEEPAKQRDESVGRSFVNCLKLLKHPIVLLSFLVIICHVGIDVGTNATAPKLLIERLGYTIEDAAIATSVYFIFRTLGCLTGSFFMRVMKVRHFFIISITMMALSMIGMACGLLGVFGSVDKWVLYIAFALVGYGNSNVFSIGFSQAMLSEPDHQNEVSGLMIMGLFGGTIFPLIMGLASDAVGQIGAVAVMALGVVYLFTFIKRVDQ